MKRKTRTCWDESLYIGKRYGRLILLEYAGIRKANRYFKCRCDCGNEKVIALSSLIQKATKSCGCLHREFVFIHGLSKTRTFKTWDSMLQRCNNPKNRSFKYYGAKGITFCERWLFFENFFADMGTRPIGTTLDRIRNDGNYEPSNCKWSTRKEQARNRRSNVLINHNEKTKCMSAWAEEKGISRTTLHERLKRGWSINKAIEYPVNRLLQ